MVKVGGFDKDRGVELVPALDPCSWITGPDDG